jgi:hypothetical protein
VHFVFLRLKVCFGNCVVKKTILVILNNYLFSSVCKLSKAPLIDSATDTDIIGTDSVAHATNVESCKPVEYQTISGGGVFNKRGDLQTPLLNLESAPVVSIAHSSIVSSDTVHRNGYTIVSDVTGMSL